MSHVHAYHYFKSTPALLQQLFAEHQPIDDQRTARIAALMKAHNALGLSTHTGMDGVPYFSGLALAHDDPRLQQSEFTKLGESRHEGQKIVYVRGRGNRKIGVAINQSIASTNADLKALPNFETWFLSKYQLQRCVMGGSAQQRPRLCSPGFLRDVRERRWEGVDGGLYPQRERMSCPVDTRWLHADHCRAVC